MKKERLFYHQSSFSGGGYLKDCHGFTIGYFETAEEAKKWCEENHFIFSLK